METEKQSFEKAILEGFAEPEIGQKNGFA